MMADIFMKHQKLIGLQVLVFSVILAIIAISGAITYSKTSIYDLQKVETKEKGYNLFEELAKPRE